MAIFRSFLIAVSLLLLAWYSYSLLSFDVQALKKTVSAGVPAKFIKADAQTIEAVTARLKKLSALPREVIASPAKNEFGRKELFSPDRS